MSIREPPLQTTWNTPPYRVLSAALKLCHNIVIILRTCSQMVRRPRSITAGRKGRGVVRARRPSRLSPSLDLFETRIVRPPVRRVELPCGAVPRATTLEDDPFGPSWT